MTDGLPTRVHRRPRHLTSLAAALAAQGIRADFVRGKAADPDRWPAGMRRLVARAGGG